MVSYYRQMASIFFLPSKSLIKTILSLVFGFSFAVAMQAQAVKVDLTQTKSWSGGFIVDATIVNDTGADINGWTLSFKLGSKIEKVSRATFTGTDPYTITSLSYSAEIPAGGSEPFSFTAAGTFNPANLGSCVFNGKACVLTANGKPIGGASSSTASSTPASSTPLSSVPASSKPAASSMPASSQPASSVLPSSIAASSTPESSIPASSTPASSIPASSIPPSSEAASSKPATTGFKHPGIYSTKAQLDFVKEKINAGAQPWKKAFDALVATNPTARTLTARAVVPGSSDPDDRKDMDEMTKDGEYAYAAALLWYFTGEKKYADHAIKTLNAWSVFQKTGMPLYLTWATPHFINAAEIMKHTSGSGWKEADIDKFSVMVEKYMWPKVQLPPVTYGSNHGTTANESMFAIAIFLDDKAKFDKAVEDYYWLLPRYIFMNTPNRLNGECNETCRDLNHTKMGTLGLMYAAESAWNQGVDLWSKDSTRYATFAELHAGIMTGQKKVPSNLCAWKSGQAGKVFCAGNVPWSSPSGAPPCNETAWEILINHIGTRLGKSIPMTRDMAVDNRPLGGITRRNPKWETLLKADVPTDL